MRKIMMAVSVLILFCGCLTIHSPAQSRLLTVQMAEFTPSFSQRDKFEYELVLNVKKISDKELFLDVEFQNPSRPKEYFKMRETIQPGQKKVAIASVPVDGIRPMRYYQVRMKVYDRADSPKPIDRLNQKLYAIVGSEKLKNAMGK